MTANDVWARPGQTGGNTAAYMMLDNGTGSEAKLVSASTDIAMMVELHESSMDAEGVMKMQQQEFIPVPENGSTELKPGGLHVMIMNLKQDLSVGDTFALKLTFEDGTEINLDVPVQQP